MDEFYTRVAKRARAWMDADEGRASMIAEATPAIPSTWRRLHDGTIIDVREVVALAPSSRHEATAGTHIWMRGGFCTRIDGASADDVATSLGIEVPT